MTQGTPALKITFLDAGQDGKAVAILSAPVLGTGVMDEEAFLALVQEVAQWPGAV